MSTKLSFQRLLPITLLCALLLPLSIIGKVLQVGHENGYDSLRTAIDSAAPGDTISVAPGIYSEHSIVIDKAVTLLGRGKATFDAKGEKNELFIVAHDSVHISGFTFKNVAVSYVNDLAAVKVKNSRHGSVIGNRFENCFFAIYLGYARHFEVKDNIANGDFESEASAGNAIHVWKGSHIKIIGNKLTHHRDGIYFEFIDDSYIANNVSKHNIRYGLHFMFSNDDVYTQNVFEDNGAGVAVMFSKRIKMLENEFRENKGGASYGLLLKEISDGRIAKNRFVRNTVGILAEGANRIDIEENEFVSNGKALDMKGNSLENKILRNNFIANTFAVVTNTSQNLNTYDKNYWSAYRGYDLDHDGVGDVPYRPVNLFAKITNEIPAAALMIHSFFVNLLEAVEKLFPEIIPAELVDPKPMMKPYDYDHHSGDNQMVRKAAGAAIRFT